MWFIQKDLKRKDILTPALMCMDLEGILSEKPGTEGQRLLIDHLNAGGWMRVRKYPLPRRGPFFSGLMLSEGLYPRVG